MTDTYMTRETLLKRIISLDDEQSWEDFVHYYGTFIDSIIAQMGIQKADGKDLSQEILLKIWRSIPKFEINQERGSFRSWLYSVTKNTVLTFITKNKYASSKMELIQIDANGQFDTPEIDRIINNEWERHISECAFNNIKESVSEQALDAFQSSLRGEPVSETAARLGLEENTIYIYKNRVKNRLIAEIRNLREMLE